jgi:hypothetical protein
VVRAGLTGPSLAVPTITVQSANKGNRCAPNAVGALPTIELPARDHTCDKCGKKGHFKAVCRTVGGVQTDSEPTKGPFLGAVSGEDSKNDEWAVELTL